MDPLGVGAALAAAAIWALVIFLYKRHMESLDAAAVNFSRLLYVAVLLAPTALFIKLAPGLWAAVVSGVVTLFVGDNLVSLNWASGLRYSKFCASANTPAETPTAAVVASNLLRVVVNIELKNKDKFKVLRCGKN
jgi:drug/metabolite transporter (DMT)-like permease